MKELFRKFDCPLTTNRLIFQDAPEEEKKGGFMGWLSGLFGGKKAEEAAPAAEAEAPAAEAPAPEGEAAPAEAPAAEAPVAEAPATCPNCGGEMTEGHVCPTTEAPAAEAPAEPAAEAPAEGEAPAAPEGEEAKTE